MYSIRDAEGRFVGSARSGVAAHRVSRRAAVGGSVERNRARGRAAPAGPDVLDFGEYHARRLEVGVNKATRWPTETWVVHERSSVPGDLGSPVQQVQLYRRVGAWHFWGGDVIRPQQRLIGDALTRARNGGESLNRAGGDGDLSTIRVLYRDRNLQLWGIPYDMRPGGQQPRDLERARDAYEEPRPGHHGPKRIVLDWIWLGGSGWYGSMSKERIAEVKRFLAHFKDAIPGNYPEWSELPKETNWPYGGANRARTIVSEKSVTEQIVGTKYIPASEVVIEKHVNPVFERHGVYVDKSRGREWQAKLVRGKWILTGNWSTIYGQP